MADWENFAKAILTEWPTGDLDGSVLFDLSLEYGMIQEIPGGYNSDHHIDAEGICPEEGDPWYEYTFRGEAGPGLYSITDMTRRIEELEGELAKATELLIQSTEENLWNAYHSGYCDEADAWTHMFMSDGEWLVREIGLDPDQARYDAEEIRDAIPATARKLVMVELKGQDDE
jgi:hypothetical protein